MIKKFLLFFLLYTLIYRPEFVFIPFGVNSFFGVCGIIVYTLGGNMRKRISSQTAIAPVRLLKSIIPFVLVAVLSVIGNGSSDVFFVRYGISIILGFFSAYLLACLFYDIYGEMKVDKLMKYILLAQFFFLIYGLLAFSDSRLADLIFSITRFERASITMVNTEGTRLISLGENFFGAGVINGFILILLAFWITYERTVPFKQMCLMIAFAFSFSISLMAARTSIIGAGIGVIIVLILLLKNRKSFVKRFLIIVISISLLIPLTNIFFKASSSNMDVLMRFGFEMFNRYEETGEFTTHSTETMLEFYDVRPDNIKTWVLGDAKWTEGKGGYYKHVDVGYLRCIFYFCILGLISIFCYYFSVLKKIFYEKKILSSIKGLELGVLFFYVFMLNFKGFADLYFLVIPFYFCSQNVGNRTLTGLKKRLYINRNNKNL